MRRSVSYFLLSSIISFAQAQQVPDGAIVPFTSVLPACASLCGPLFDVQGACAPNGATATSTTCFCADTRLTPFLNAGTASVASVCGPASCSATADLQKIQSWYAGFCNDKDPNATGTAATSTATGTKGTGTSTAAPSTKSKAPPKTWFQSHWPYIIMLIVMIIAIVGGWVGAIFIKRAYIRKKEREFEMSPPVAWGPHQMQGATGGYNFEEGNKEARGMSSPAGPTDKLQTGNSGWLRKQRS